MRLNSASHSARQRAVDDAVIDAQRAGHHRGDRQRAVLHHRPLLPGGHRQDRRLRRVDDGGEVAARRTCPCWRSRSRRPGTPRASACRLRARPARSFISLLIAARPFWSALRTIGVISPSGIDTATEMSTSSYSTIASSVQLAFTFGTRRSVDRRGLDDQVVDRELERARPVLRRTWRSARRAASAARRSRCPSRRRNAGWSASPRSAAAR